MLEIIEILGDELEEFFEEKGYGTLKYKGPDFEVWELSETEYDKLCQTTDDEWNNCHWGWWRYGHSIYEGTSLYRYRVNGEIMLGYIDYDKLALLNSDLLEDNEFEEFDTSYFTNREYKDFREWACEVMGHSTETNIACLATSLAKENGVTLAGFMEIYQP